MWTTQDIQSFILSALAYSGSAVAIAYFVFHHFTKGWLDNLFARRIEDLRHQQARELQNLRVEVESILSGTVKLQDRDFEVLPVAWEKLNDAHRTLAGTLAAFQSYPDLNRCTPTGLKEILDSSELSQSTIERIKEATDNTTEYIQSITWKRIIGQLCT